MVEQQQDVYYVDENKAGYTAISRVRLGRGSNAQKSTKKLREKNGGPTDGRTEIAITGCSFVKNAFGYIGVSA